MDIHYDFSPNMLTRDKPAKPVYDQVADLLRMKIRLEGMKKGDPLPRICQIAEQLDISRITVRSAIAMLVKEGIVRSQRGKGTFVERELPNLPTFKTRMKIRDHMNFSTGTDVKVVLSEKCADNSMILAPEEVKYPSYRRVKHINSKGGHVYADVELFLESAMFDESPQKYEGQLAMRATIAFLGTTFDRVQQTLTIAKANMEHSQNLGIPIGDPIAHIVRLVLDTSGKAAYIGHIVYPGTGVQIMMDMEF